MVQFWTATEHFAFMIRREVEIVVISDVHLGTYACHSQELLQYLRSIRPRILVLNGDIIDAWHFRRSFFSNEHLAIIEYILKLSSEGTKVYYLSGNHDDIVRGYSPIVDGNIILRNHLEFVIDQKRYWIFHGDIFDTSVRIAPWLAKMGLKSYKYLVRFNRLVDKMRKYLGLPPISLAQKVKHKVRKAIKYISDFENIVAKHAEKKDFDVVICGHIHVPAIKKMNDGKVTYMNAGDWIENLTALEYQHRRWKIHHYDPADYPPISKRLQVPLISMRSDRDLRSTLSWESA